MAKEGAARRPWFNQFGMLLVNQAERRSKTVFEVEAGRGRSRRVTANHERIGTLGSFRRSSRPATTAMISTTRSVQIGGAFRLGRSQAI